MLGKRALKAGQSICGGWRGAFDSWTGDWKERALSHCFIRRNYQSTQVCDQCLAVKPFARTPERLLHLVFTDFSETAPWRSTLQSHDDYLQNTPVDQRTPWLDIPGFVISRVKWDSAHTILLGTGKDLAASVLFDYDSWLHQVATLQVQHIWGSIPFSRWIFTTNYISNIPTYTGFLWGHLWIENKLLRVHPNIPTNCNQNLQSFLFGDGYAICCNGGVL